MGVRFKVMRRFANRQRVGKWLSVGVLLAILEAAPEIRVPFRVDSHHSSKP
jgi:hypothetical protein